MPARKARVRKVSGRKARRPEAGVSVRERGEREARFLARAIPEEGRVVGLVYPGSGAARSATAAAGIASAVGLRREHTLLAGTESGPGTLDETIGGGDGPGLALALAGEARLTDVALRGERRPYVYLPAGAAAPPPASLVADAELRRFAERARARGGTLLLHLPEEALPEAAGLLDGYVSLGTLSVPAPRGVEEYGRVLFPEEDAAGAEASGAEPRWRVPSPAGAGAGPADRASRTPAGEAEDSPAGGAAEPPSAASAEPSAGGPGRAGSRWRRHRARAGAPVVRSVIGALIVVALGVGWWILSRESIAGAFGPPGSGGGPEAGPVVEEGPGRTPGGGGAGAEGEAGAPGAGADLAAGRDGRLAAAAEAAPELPYSVLIASYARASDAEARVNELRERRSTLFFVSPTPVRGRLYHRVFAGARGDADAARGLMEELVRSGRKEASSAWDVRPARFAFRLGVYGSRSDARAAVREAVAAGIPSYLLPGAAVEGDTAFLVYAGAYESEVAARAMATMLERAGRPGELVTRRGLLR